jgi:hypothetical protein
LGFLLGGFVGNAVTRAMAQRHQHTHAVMWLADFHLRRLQAPGVGSSCQGAAGEITSLRFLQGELPQAFPLLYVQDAEFRTRAEALGIALKDDSAGGDCAAVAKQMKRIEAACDECHREYR